MSDENRQTPEIDKSAFADLVRRWEKPLFVTAFRILDNRADAEEARQNVLLRILGKPELVPSAGFEPWIRRCVINESLAELRSRKRERAANEKHLEGQNGFVVLPGYKIERSEITNALHAALNELDPESRAMLSLRFDEGLTIREIAEAVEKPHTTVQSQLQSAYRKLRVKLALFVNE